MLFSDFADGGLERDVLGFGRKSSCSEKCDCHEGFYEVFLLLIKQIVFDFLVIKLKLSLSYKNLFKGKRFFFLEDFDTGN